MYRFITVASLRIPLQSDTYIGHGSLGCFSALISRVSCSDTAESFDDHDSSVRDTAADKVIL